MRKLRASYLRSGNRRGPHKWVQKDPPLQVLHSPEDEPCTYLPSDPSQSMKDSIGPLNPLRSVMRASNPYEALRTWSNEMTLNENLEPKAVPPQQLPFEEFTQSSDEWAELWAKFQKDFVENNDLDFGIFARSDTPSENFFFQEEFFTEYIREQVSTLPQLLETREVVSRDTNGQVIAAKIATCDRVAGAPPKPLREMCPAAKAFARRVGKDVEDYVMPPTAKADALQSLSQQLNLISKKSNWKSLVNDRKSHFAANIAEFSEKLASTRTGAPLPNFMEAGRGFRCLFEDVVEGFDKTKSTGFESRIRTGSKAAWVETPTALAHLYYRVVCKIILLIVQARSLSVATPEDMVFKHLVRDPTEVSETWEDDCRARMDESESELQSAKPRR